MQLIDTPSPRDADASKNTSSTKKYLTSNMKF